MEIKKISDVKLNPNNPRLIKDDKFKKLVQSIKEFPEMLSIRPIVVNKDMIILGGNMRFRACKEAGIKEIPVIITDLSEEKQREFLIKDNTSGGEWDWDMIANEWDAEELVEWGLDIPNFVIDDLGTAEEDDFDVPDGGIETDIVLGDLFEIGEHRLICGDSTDSDSVAKLMDGQKADMVFTDPPYGVDYKGINNDDRGGLEDLLNSAFKNYLLNVKVGASIYCFHSDKCADIFHKVFREYCHFSSMIIWEKESIVLSQTDYQSKHESCLYGWFDNGTHKWYSDRKQQSIWISKSIRENGHTTPKPIEIVSKAINNSSLKLHLIFDLFLGSGSTMVASHQLNRKCYGMELDPKYCQVIVDRMIKLDSTLVIKKNGQPYDVQSK